jgi:predicted nucleic acid-binding protein
VREGDTLLAAKRASLLESVRPELDALVRTSFFLSPKLYDQPLRAAGEIDS